MTGNDNRSRDALGARVFRKCRWVSCERSVTHHAERWVSLRSTHPTKRNDKRKKEAERRQTCSANLRALRARRAPLSLLPPSRAGKGWEGRARLSAFHRGSSLGDRTPLLSFRHALPATWSGRTIPKLRTTGFERPCASQRALPAPSCPSPASSSQTGHNAGRACSRSRPGADCIVPRAGTALAPPLGIPSRQASLVSEIRCIVYLKWGPMSIHCHCISDSTSSTWRSTHSPCNAAGSNFREDKP